MQVAGCGVRMGDVVCVFWGQALRAGSLCSFAAPSTPTLNVRWRFVAGRLRASSEDGDSSDSSPPLGSGAA